MAKRSKNDGTIRKNHPECDPGGNGGICSSDSHWRYQGASNSSGNRGTARESGRAAPADTQQIYQPKMIAEEFLGKIILISMLIPISVTSWIRSKQHNKEVGGDLASLHIIALAVDVVPDDPRDGYRLEILCKRFGLHFRKESDHYHLQALPAA